MISRKINSTLISAVFGLGFCIALVPCSQAVIISPIHLEMSVKKPISTFKVTNESARVVTYQSNTLSWAQVDGKDSYIETNELVVTPPIVSIKPNSTQTFRVALFKASSHLVEQSYRIVLEDIYLITTFHCSKRRYPSRIQWFGLPVNLMWRGKVVYLWRIKVIGTQK
ncbi:MAG: P pilus assembly chaperone PapD [Paraglaciecola sp.]|jgi:P pilus assembly chaperone PapD